MIARSHLGRAAAFAAALVFACASAASADVKVGGHVGLFTDDVDPSVGAEMVIPLAPSWSIVPNFDAVFGGVDNYIFSGDFQLDVGSAFWLGAGPAVIVRDGNGGDDADVGLNLLGGVGFDVGSVLMPYIQLKVMVADHTRGALQGGVRF